MNNLEILKQDINLPWDVERFKISRSPEFVCDVDPTFLLTYRENVLDMLINWPGENRMFVPKNLWDNGFYELINVIFKFEESINPNWQNYYCYLTCNSGFVEAGKSQRNPGAHFDGMQGFRYKTKFPVCHQYLVASSLPTIYYFNSFNFSRLNNNKHNFFKACDKQKRLGMRAEPNKLYLQTAYNVHESPAAAQKIYRSFIRVEFSLKKSNRLGNTVNPLIKNGKYFIFEPRPIPSHLI